MMLKYNENRLHSILKKIQNLSNFYKKYDDLSFSHLILTKIQKNNLGNPTQPKN